MRGRRPWEAHVRPGLCGPGWVRARGPPGPWRGGAEGLTSECRGGGNGETEGEEKIVSTVNEKGQKPTITASSTIGHCLIRQWPIVS